MPTPTRPKSEFLDILTSRSFIHQTSDQEGIDDLASKDGLIAYVGYDCTAPSLHVGSLISIMMLHWLQQTANKPIVLMGGGTNVAANRQPQLAAAGDRVAMVARLFHAGKVERIICTGTTSLARTGG